MRKYQQNKTVVMQDELSEIVCNKCGESFSEKDDYHFWDQMIHNIELNFGYGSKFDTEWWSFDLCDQCLEDIVKTFKHKPDGFGEYI